MPPSGSRTSSVIRSGGPSARASRSLQFDRPRRVDEPEVLGRRVDQPDGDRTVREGAHGRDHRAARGVGRDGRRRYVQTLAAEGSQFDTSIVAAHRRSIFSAALVGAAIFAGTALAAAKPLTPQPGETVRSAHPDFTWALPTNEQSEAISIANEPDVTPEGKFYDENFVDGDLLPTDVREWAPSTPLWAGQYWWNVWSTDRNTFASYYSAPAEFTIPVAMTLRGVTTKRYLFLHSLDVVVRLTANVQRPLVRVRLLRGRKLVWKATEKAYGSMSEVVSSSFTWQRPRRIKQGTRLKLIASISSGGDTQTRSLVVRAP